MKITIKIIFEDDSIIAVEKPSGLLSIPDRFNAEIPNVLDLLKRNYPSILTVHRIDKETSGILIFAKTITAHKSLSMDFQERNITKKYLAFVKGVVSNKNGEINVPIKKSATSSRMKVHEKGKESHTKYTVLATYKHHSLVSIELLTGRTHQIRVHMAYIHHPLMVDQLYNKSSGGFYLSEIMGKRYKRSEGREERPLINRLTLHAFSIAFQHPITLEPMYFEADFPKDLKALKKQLEKHL